MEEHFRRLAAVARVKGTSQKIKEFEEHFQNPFWKTSEHISKQESVHHRQASGHFTDTLYTSERA